MRLTQYTDYAMRVLIYLGASSGQRHTISEIARAYGISHNHLTKVVQHLNRHGFVEATRGKGGGVTLARDPRDIVIGHVARQMEPATALVECFDPNGHCAIQGQCKLTGALRQAFNAFMSVLDGYTLADIIGSDGHRLRSTLGITVVTLDN